MADVIRLVVGDDRPVITISFTDDITGLPYDVSTSTVSVRFRQKGIDDVLIATIPCSLGPATNQAQFDFTSGVLDGIEPGHYEGEVVIDEGSQIQTVYQVINFRIRQNFLVTP
jgi:hypothetical protein